MKKSKIQSLREIVEIATSPGNYDYSEYMLGMANGLILALAIMENKDPVYLEIKERKENGA